MANTNPTPPAPPDPHYILQQIADLDASIAEKQNERRILIAHFEETIALIQKHADDVLYSEKADSFVKQVDPESYPAGRW